MLMLCQKNEGRPFHTWRLSALDRHRPPITAIGWCLDACHKKNTNASRRQDFLPSLDHVSRTLCLLHYVTETSHLYSLRDFWRHFCLSRAAAHSDRCFLRLVQMFLLTYLLTPSTSNAKGFDVAMHRSLSYHNAGRSRRQPMLERRLYCIVLHLVQIISWLMTRFRYNRFRAYSITTYARSHSVAKSAALESDALGGSFSGPYKHAVKSRVSTRSSAIVERPARRSVSVEMLSTVVRTRCRLNRT